jgi:predicted small integral membrane protein
VTLRVAKMALVLAVALFYSFVVFNNVTDYNSNYQFIRHGLLHLHHRLGIGHDASRLGRSHSTRALANRDMRGISSS